jgi:hypothetical protein
MTTRRISSTKKAPAKGSTRKPAAKKPAKKKAPAKKPAPKASAKKAPAKKPAPKASAKKAPAKKPAPKKAVAKKAVAKKVVAKKGLSRKDATRRAAEHAAVAALDARRSQAQQAIEAAQAGSLVNHIAFVVDRSGSMQRIRAKVVQVFNAQLAALVKSSEESGQETFVSFYTFHSNVDAPRFFARPISKVAKLTALSCTGMTALFDAVGQSIVDLGEIDAEKRDNVSFLIVVLTDGHENHSRRYKAKIKDMLQQAQSTGRWTFAFLVPKGGETVLRRFGIPQGNIQTWQTTTQGLRDLGQDMQRGLQTFYTARQKGQRAVVGVFTTNLTGAAKEAVSTALHDASADFLRIAVHKDAAIRELVDKELGSRGSYKKGHAYYELTKPELVQESKELAIMEKERAADGTPGRIYTGDAARTLLGLPLGERCRVKPGDHGGFGIFVQSTSVNRRLVAGTTLLYRKDVPPA